MRHLPKHAAVAWLVGCLTALASLPVQAQDGSLLRVHSRSPGSAQRLTNQSGPSLNDPFARQAPAQQPPSQRPGTGASAGYPADGNGRGAAPGQSAPANVGELPPPSQPSAQRPPLLTEASWYYRPPISPRTFRHNDIVTIRVDEIARMQAEGNSESRRNTLYDALLKDWIRFVGLDTIKPNRQADGDQRIQGSTNQLYRADASLESRQSFTFNIAARVVDVRPSGELVLEARKVFEFDDNVWEYEVTGACRPIDITADNVVLSKDLLDLQVKKMERGRLRDGYKRGWFSRFVDTVSPF